jgi:hypothetical protein
MLYRGQQQPGLNDQGNGCPKAVLKGWHKNESEIKTTTIISFLFLLAHVRLEYRTSFLPSTTMATILDVGYIQSMQCEVEATTILTAEVSWEYIDNMHHPFYDEGQVSFNTIKMT